MLNKSIEFKLFLLLIILNLTLNIIFYHFLPANIIIHLNSDGTNGYTSKNLFMLFSPLIITLIYVIQRFIKQTNCLINISVCIFIFVINTFILYINVK